MDDVCLEYRIDREKGRTDKLIRIGAAAGAVLLILLAFYTPLGVLPAIVWCIAACIICSPRFNVEFEYLFVAGELSIDCIYGKRSRKNAANYAMNDVEIIARKGDARLNMYSNVKLRTRDFSSGRADAESYVLVCRTNGSLDYTLIEPGEEIIRAIYDRYPNKCVRQAN